MSGGIARRYDSGKVVTVNKECICVKVKEESKDMER